MTFQSLKRAIEDVTATVSVIGQGYVGLPLAMALCGAGYKTFGIDVNAERVAQLNAGRSYILDVPDHQISNMMSKGLFSATTDFSVIERSHVVVVCVPTPLRKSKDPDVSYILDAVDRIKAHMHKDLLIILESTTYPGTTDELIVANISQMGMTVGRDFFACFSPERVDPGNAVFQTHNTPKVLGGVTPACLELGTALYGKVMEKVVPVSSARVAEMVKLLENTFRAVNIGLVNEMSLMCERLGIDIWEVVDAAATKPFGYMPFYPGPGIGGHCIPLDPMYLSWKAKMVDFYNRFIELASDINGNMPRHVVNKIAEALNLEGKSVRGSRILLLGMAYKRNIDDLRESPSLEVYRLLKLQGAKVDFSDPLVPTFREGDQVVNGVHLDSTTLSEYDCAVLTTDHSAFDYPWIAEHSRLIVDTRNAFKGVHAPHIIRLGTPTPTPDEWDRVKSARDQQTADQKGVLHR